MQMVKCNYNDCTNNFEKEHVPNFLGMMHLISYKRCSQYLGKDALNILGKTQLIS